MMTTATPSKRFQRTQKLIRDTFKEMLCTMDASSITVSSIAKHADINRKTFYLHYDTRDDLFYEICDSVVQRYTEAVFQTSDEDWPYAFCPVFFDFFSNEEPHVERIICDPTLGFYCERILHGCANANKKRGTIVKGMSSDELQLLGDHWIESITRIYRRWVEGGKSIPLDTVVSFAFKMILPSMTAFSSPESKQNIISRINPENDAPDHRAQR